MWETFVHDIFSRWIWSRASFSPVGFGPRPLSTFYLPSNTLLSLPFTSQSKPLRLSQTLIHHHRAATTAPPVPEVPMPSSHKTLKMADAIKRILYATEEEFALAEAQKILSESIDASKTDASTTLIEKSQEDGQ
ncbi:hypothetical protein Droror1_Dr00000619 [Drosera rotundifolia]